MTSLESPKVLGHRLLDKNPQGQLPYECADPKMKAQMAYKTLKSAMRFGNDPIVEKINKEYPEFVNMTNSEFEKLPKEGYYEPVKFWSSKDPIPIQSQ